jgi:2-phosphosulfolactate phosphatase
VARGFGTATHPVLVIAAGEWWPDGSLRPAVEDGLRAGAVLSHLRSAGRGLSAEAHAMATTVDGTRDVEAAIGSCASARLLGAAGYGGDVEVAARLDCDQVVPLLQDGAFEPA